MSTINISSYSTLTTKSGIGGLASGLDTDELIKNMTAGINSKITSTLQKQQQAIWKRDQYREISTKMSDFNKKYLSYANPSTNLLSSKFYQVASAQTDSKYVKISGDVTAAKDMVIKDIQSLATSAQFTSSKKVTDQELSSGLLRESWEVPTAVGKSLTISLGDKNYSLTVGEGTSQDSQGSATDNIQNIVDNLNKQIAATGDLKDKVAFDFDGNTVTLKQTDSSTPSLKLTAGDHNLLRGLGLSTATTAAASITGTQVNGTALFEKNYVAGGQFTVKVGDTEAKLTLDKNFKFSAEALATNDSGSYTNDALQQQALELQSALNSSVNGTALAGKLSFLAFCKDGSIQLTTKSSDGSSLQIVSGDTELLNGMGLSASVQSANGKLETNVSSANLYSHETKTLSDSLAGTSVAFSLNGISKNVEFKESDKDQYATIDGLVTYLQSSLDKAFGSDKISVSLDGGQLKMRTAGSGADSGSGSILTLASANAGGVIGMNGALRMRAGESNRIEQAYSLGEIADKLATPLAAGDDGKYTLRVNGKDFSFTKDTLLGDVISAVNRDQDAGVTISYSSITDSFHVSADDTGAQGAVDISDVSGNLAASLFGTKGVDYTAIEGTDMRATMSFDGGNTYTDVFRTTNSFQIDGANLEILGKGDDDEVENITFSVSQNTDDLIDKVKDFVDSYNEIMDWMQTKTTEKLYGRENYDDDDEYLPLTSEQKEKMSETEIKEWNEHAQKGLLHDDQTLNTISTNFRRAMGDVVAGTQDALYKLGITTSSVYSDGGKLVIDESKLRTALTEDPDSLERVMTTQDTGVAYRLQKALQSAAVGNSDGVGLLVSMAGSSSSMSSDSSFMTQQISNYSDQVTKLKSQMKTEETRLWSQFSYLEQYISQMNSQQSYLDQMFSSN